MKVGVSLSMDLFSNKKKGIDKKYVRYESAADQFIGRILSMLDLNSPNFATLSPHFDRIDEIIMNAVRQCFPRAPAQLQPVLTHVLASLVFHAEYLQRVLPSEHPVFNSVVFTQGFTRTLRGRVALVFQDDKVFASGIPPHAAITRRLDAVEQRLVELPEKLTTAFHDELEKRAFDAGQLTRDSVEKMFGALLARVAGELRGIVAPQHAQAAAEGQGQEQPVAGVRTWMLDGRVCRVPREFKFNSRLSTQSLFQLYCLGDQNTQIGPYRKLESVDFIDGKQKKRLSDMHALLRPVQAALKQQKRWKNNATLEEVNTMWDLGKSVIGVDGRTQQGRKRRLTQVAWTTQLKEYRKKGRVDEMVVESDGD